MLIVLLFAQIPNSGFNNLSPLLQKKWNIGFNQLGFLLAVNGLVYFIMAIPSGEILKRFHPKRIIVSSLIIITIGTVIIGFSRSFGIGLFGRLIWQIGFTLAFVGLLSAISKNSPKSLKATFMALAGATTSLSFTFGAPIGAFATKTFGIDIGFVFLAMLPLLGAIILLFIKKMAFKDEIEETIEKEASSEKQKQLYRSGRLWLLCFLTFLAATYGSTLGAFGPVALQQNYHLSVTSAAMVLSIGAIGNLLAQIVVGYLGDRFNRYMLLIFLFVLLGASTLIMNSTNVNIFIGGYTVYLVFGFCAPNLIYAIGSDLSEKQIFAGMGIMNTGIALGELVGPQMAGVIRGVTGGFSAVWFICSAAMGLGFLVVLFLKFYRKSSITLEEKPNSQF